MKFCVKFSLLLFLLTASAFCELKMPRVFTDHMVFQQKVPVKVFGTANPGAKVTVVFNGKNSITKAGKDGKWITSLKPMKASAVGKTLKVSSNSESLAFKDVVVGEVWFACGQSNMRWEVRQSSTGADTIGKASNKLIRLLDFRAPSSMYPKNVVFDVAKLEEVKKDPTKYYTSAGWQVADNGKVVSSFSAVAYYFAERVQQELNVPVGIIHTAIGGTTTECYISKEALLADKELKPLATDWLNAKNYSSWAQGRARHNLSGWAKAGKQGVGPHPFEPGFLFDAGIRPMIPYSIKGFIWYQGESNAPTGGRGVGGYKGGYDIDSSRLKLDTMVKDWHQRWNNSKLPFYHVQLPGMNRPWPLYREMQLELLQRVKYSGVAVTYDVGHPTNVHPGNKKPVGNRLALWALAKQYGKKVAYSGPIYKGFKTKGNKVVVSFNYVGKGKSALAATDGGQLKGFVIAGKNGKFVPAKAKINGSTVEVWSDEVPKPANVRYAWENDPLGKANLGNKAGLLASPFRTDRDSDGNY